MHVICNFIFHFPVFVFVILTLCSMYDFCKNYFTSNTSFTATTTTERPHATKSPGFVCMDDLTTKRSFDLQATWAIGLLGLLLAILSTGVCTTRHRRPVDCCRNLMSGLYMYNATCIISSESERKHWEDCVTSTGTKPIGVLFVLNTTSVYRG